MKILKERIYQTLDMQQPPEQGGFRKGFSTADHIQAIGQLIEKAREHNMTVYMMFIDFRKAFDSIYHDYIWQALADHGVPQKIIVILHNLYSKAKAQIKMEKTGKEFETGRGVKQGDPLSSNIFNCVLEQAFRKVNWEKKGIRVNGRYLNNLRFADDIVLISDQLIELEEMANELKIACEEVGLEINIHKTKVMHNAEEDSKIEINGVAIENVDEYKYLGQVVAFTDKSKKELKARISNAWKAFWAHKEIFQSRIDVKMKINVLESCVYSVLTYGAQTWSLTKQQILRIKRTQNAMLRKILGVKLLDKIENSKIKEMAQTRCMGYICKRIKMKYAGHMAREKNYEKWNLALTTWIPFENKRKKGRPAMRWVDEIRKIVGPQWTSIAQDRKRWRNVTETHASRWAD